MRAPSRNRLLATFGDLTPESARLIRKLAHVVDDRDALASLIEGKCEKTHDYVRQMYSSPYISRMWRRTVVLHAIDVALGTYGVEPLGYVHVHNGPPYEYCNIGDTYAATLVYKRATDSVIIASWGDLAEKDPILACDENTGEWLHRD